MVFPRFFSWPGFSGFNFPLNQSIDTSVFFFYLKWTPCLGQVPPGKRESRCPERVRIRRLAWTKDDMARHKNLAGHADLTNMGSPCFFLKGHVENLMDWDLMRTSGFGWEFFTNRIRSWEYLASEAPENSGVPVFFNQLGAPPCVGWSLLLTYPLWDYHPGAVAVVEHIPRKRTWKSSRILKWFHGPKPMTSPWFRGLNLQ